MSRRSRPSSTVDLGGGDTRREGSGSPVLNGARGGADLRLVPIAPSIEAARILAAAGASAAAVDAAGGPGASERFEPSRPSIVLDD